MQHHYLNWEADVIGQSFILLVQEVAWERDFFVFSGRDFLLIFSYVEPMWSRRRDRNTRVVDWNTEPGLLSFAGLDWNLKTRTGMKKTRNEENPDENLKGPYTKMSPSNRSIVR